MLVLKTDKGERRYCSYCKTPMRISKETDEILLASCPNWRGGRDERHETILSYKSMRAVVEYFKELFAPAMNAD